jgi:beta-lactamase regulating signal transducer with metallopeptidase domain
MSSHFLLILLTSSVRVALVAALVGLVLFVMRARGGSPSHAAWTVVLCAMLLMPVLPSMVQPIAVSVPISQPDFRMLSDAAVTSMPDAPDLAFTATVAPSAPLEKGAGPVLQVKGAVPLFQAVGWADVVMFGYLLIVAILLVRLIASAWRVSHLQRRAIPLEIEGAGAPAYSSRLVNVPVTTGVLRPRVLLPDGWATWPAEKLAAVLAHERAHILRRDPLTHWLAYVNRCVFWFHPLAWWLERKLSATAEQACDAAAVRAIGDRQQYAKVLLDMADAVRRHGGRVAWAGVGIDGAGQLGQRIDQVLEGKDPSRLSRARKAAIAFGCTAAIFIVIACRQQLAATPLREDPEVTARYAQQKAQTQLYESARAMTAQQAAELDAAVRRNPEDLEATRKLLIFYAESGQKVLGWNETMAARRPHMLWLIEHHPESELAVYRSLRPQTDPQGYAEAKKLWLGHVAAPNASVAVLSNAARFFQVADKPMAEQILLRLQSMDPGGPMPRIRDNVYYEPWIDRLGRLYALAILGANDGTIFNVVNSVSLDEAHSPYTQAVRRKLDESKDPALLYAAGSYLAQNASQAKVDLDHVALGRSYLERAVQLDPSSRARTLLISLRANDRNRRVREALRAKEIDLVGGETARKARARERLTPDQQKAIAAAEYAAVLTLPEADRFAYLPVLADSSYGIAEFQNQRDVATAKASWERSQKYAQDLLALAPKYKDDPHYGDAIFEGNVVLALNTLRAGDVKGAVRYMGDAAKASNLSDDFEYASGSLRSRLANYLLKAGERESVADFLEHTARISTREKDQLLKDAAAIRAGRMPWSYQSMYSRPS